MELTFSQIFQVNTFLPVQWLNITNVTAITYKACTLISEIKNSPRLNRISQSALFQWDLKPSLINKTLPTPIYKHIIGYTNVYSQSVMVGWYVFLSLLLLY